MTAEMSWLHRTIVLAVVIVPFLAVGLAAWHVWERYVTWGDLALLFGLYIPISVGVTGGYHRMLTHRSFRAHPIVRFVLLALGSMAVEGAAISWAANHLKHHAYADREGDPHSPIEGFFHAHLGWLFGPDEADPHTYGRFLLEDRLVVFIHNTFFLWVGLSLLIPFAIGGWSGLLWGGLVRMFFVHHVTWSVNSVCHTFGSKPYATEDRSRNNWVIGLLGMGEGFHNAHHRWPSAAIHGMDRWQFDATALIIQTLEKIRLVTDVHRIPIETRLRARASRGSATPMAMAAD